MLSLRQLLQRSRREAVCQRLEHAELDSRRVVQKRAERARGDHEQPGVCGRAHGGRPRRVGDERDLAEEITHRWFRRNAGPTCAGRSPGRAYALPGRLRPPLGSPSKPRLRRRRTLFWSVRSSPHPGLTTDRRRAEHRGAPKISDRLNHDPGVSDRVRTHVLLSYPPDAESGYPQKFGAVNDCQ